MKELGDILRSEREKQGLTLRAISDKARVSISMLQSLEQGNLEQIGTPLLIRGFIRSYCSALGIDSSPILEKYQGEIIGYDRMDEAIRQYGVWSRAFRRKNRWEIIAVLALVIVVMGAICGGAWFYNKRARQSLQKLNTAVYPQLELPSDLREGSYSASASREPETGQASSGEGRTDSEESKTPVQPVNDGPREERLGKEPSVEEPKDTAEVASAEKLSLLPSSVEQRKHHLEVEAHEECWISVVIDGKTPQEAMLKSGDKREWNAQDKLKLTLGNAQGVELKWDGKPLTPTIPRGRVLRLQLPDQKVTNNPREH